jgi:hypothetical protein
MSWILFKIHQSHLKFDEDHESVSNLDHSLTVEELSVYFRCTSGKIEFSNFLKLKSEFCSPHNFYQFKHILSKEEVGYLWSSSLKHEYLMSDARCPSLLLCLWKISFFLCVWFFRLICFILDKFNLNFVSKLPRALLHN